MGNQHSDMTDGSMERDQALERRVHRQDGRQHSNSLIIAGEKLSTPGEFVLVPVSVAARNSCCSLRRRGDAAATPTASLSAVAATTVTTEPPPLARIPLLDGDNIVGAGASNRLGLGIPKDTKNVAEKQVLLRTTNAPRGSVLLKAFSSSVRIRRRDSARATPPPSPRLPRSPRSPRSPRPTRSPRSPPRSPWSARRGGHATSKCDTSTGGGGRGGRGDGGGSTSVVAAGAQQYLLVGETLDLDAADSSQSAYSYTLEYASAATTAATSDPPPRFANSSISNGNRNSHSSRKNGSGFWPVLAPRGVDLTGQLPGARGTPKTATPSTASSSARGGVSGGNGGTTAKRRLEGIFAADDTGTVSRMMARDAQSARTDVARDIHGAESTRHRSSPGATAVDASDSGARQERARGSTTPTCGPSRKRQRDGDRTSTSPFCPSGVIDLCDLDDLPVDAGASKDQPLDLCDSDDEGLVEHVRLAAEAEEQASCVVCIAVVSPVKRSYAANLPPPGPGGTEDARGLAVATVVRPVSFCELERSPATAAWALSPTWERSTPSTGEKLDADEDKDKEKDDDGKREASLLSSSLSPKKPRPPPSPPLAQPAEQRGEKEDRTRPVIRSLPPVGVSAAVSNEADSARADVVASITTAAAAVKEEAATAPPPVQRPPTTRSLPCNGHQFLSILKPYIQDCPEVALGATEEVLASGARLPSGLCGLIMTELLKSRCKFRTEFLRRQLRAVLSAPPSSSSSSPSSSPGCCWRPPDNAPGWLEAVMLGITRNDDGDGDGGGGDSSSALARASAIAALDAHVAVLEVVVNYLVSGGPSAEGRDRVGQLFALEGQAKRKAGKAKTGPMEMARRAVERCADWAVGAWSAAASVRGRRGYGPAGGSARHVGDLDPARARARLLTVRLLSGVVEACGLPVREACVAILDRMDAVGLPPAVAREVDAGKGASAAYTQGGCGEGGGGGGGCGTVTLPRRRLGAVACEGLVRALCWRPFGAELARVLSADLPAAGSAAGDVEADVVRLRLILSRAIRRASGGAGGCLLLL